MTRKKPTKSSPTTPLRSNDNQATNNNRRISNDGQVTNTNIDSNQSSRRERQENTSTPPEDDRQITNNEPNRPSRRTEVIQSLQERIPNLRVPNLRLPNYIEVVDDDHYEPPALPIPRRNDTLMDPLEGLQINYL